MKTQTGFGPEDHKIDLGEPTERLVTINEVAERLAISRDTVYRLVRSGKIETLRVGERLRFRPTAIEAYLERNRIEIRS